MAKSDIYATPDRNRVPTSRITVINARNEPSAIASNMDIDRVNAVIVSAQAGNMTPMMTLYRDILLSDSHIQGEFNKRKLAVLGDQLSIQPFNDKSKDDKKAADLVTDSIGGLKGWIMACSHLLDGSLWPVSILEKVFTLSNKPGLTYDVKELVPVPHRLIDFSDGTLRIFDVDEESGMVKLSSHVPDPERYIVHRGHLLSYPDCFGGPMRSLVFWWLFSAMDRTWWARYLDRYGSPFLVGKYDQNDDPSRVILERAFSYAVKIGGLVVSKDTQVEIQNAASSGSGDAYEKFLAICQREKSKLILGQTLSAEAQATGMNSGQAVGHEKVRQDYRVFDGLMLGATLREQLFEQLIRINGLSGMVPSATWGAESVEDIKALTSLLSGFNAAGLEVDDTAISILSKRCGFDLRRKEKSPISSDLQFKTLSADLLGLDQIARGGSADLSQAFRGALAPVRRILIESTSADDFEKRIRAYYSDWSPGRLATLIEHGLVAYAARAAGE